VVVSIFLAFQVDDWNNKNIHTALLQLQQAQKVLSTVILIQTIGSAGANLASKYPDLIQLESYFDSNLKEMRSTYSCELKNAFE
jgi:hypothetical protein